MSDVILHGRRSECEAVQNSPRRLHLVKGDSGIGKSSFLSSLASWPGEPVVSSPVVLKSVEGALQTAFADAISECIMIHLGGAKDVRQAWTMMKSMAERAATVTGKEIGKAILARALSYAEAKVGAEAFAIGKAVIGDFARGGTLGFDDQLAAIRVPDRAKELCDIAKSVSESIDRPLVLRFDNAERLAPADHGLLADLADSITGAVTAVVCVSEHHEAGDSLIRQLEVRGTAPLQLSALSAHAVDEWLSAEQVPPEIWDTIIQLSSGYPFFIADAIRLAKQGASLGSIGTPNGFEALMRASWSGIALTTQTAASFLAPFIEPPSDGFLQQYLDLDPVGWSIMRADLLESGMFVNRSDGKAWFHDRRRSYIWERTMTLESRRHIAIRALKAIAAWMEAQDGLALWVPSATSALIRAAGQLPEVLSRDFTALADEELALLWGLIEVSETGGGRARAAEIGEVVRHAEARAGRGVDALISMHHLEEIGLISTHESDDARRVDLILDSSTEYAALLGEILFRFHVMPRPSMASAAFDGFIRPLLGPFDAAIIRLGGESLAEHKHQTAALSAAGGTGNPDTALALGATVKIDGQRISFTAGFSSAESRDAAKEAILTVGAHTSRIKVDRVLDLPPSRLRYARYRRAAESFDLGQTSDTSPSADVVVAFLTAKARLTNALAEAGTVEEQEALDLDPRRFLVDLRLDDKAWTSFEVLTDRTTDTQDITELMPNPRDPLLELRLRGAGYLTGTERITSTSMHWGAQSKLPHPMTSLTEELEQSGKAYNKGLRPVLFPPDPLLLQQLIQAEQRRLHQTIDALSRAGLGDVGQQAQTLLISLWEAKDGLWTGDLGNWSAEVIEIDDGQGNVVVERLPEPPPPPRFPRMRVPDVFVAYADAPATTWSSGDATAVLAPLIGYTSEDARLTDLNTPLGRLLGRTHEIVGRNSEGS